MREYKQAGAQEPWRQVGFLFGFYFLSILFVCMGGAGLSFAQAFEDEGQAAFEGATASKFDGPPPPQIGAWQGSAMDQLLLEEGVDVSRRRRRSPWSTRYFGLYTAGLIPMREGVGRISAYNYLSLDYRLSWEKRISVRPEFFFNTAGRDMFNGEMGSFRDRQFTWGDVYIQYAQRDLGLFSTPWGQVGLFGAFRAYIPTSDNSKRQQWVTRFNPRLSFQMPLGDGYWIQYHLRSMIYAHTRAAYRNEFFNVRTNEALRLENWLQFSKFFEGSRYGVHQQFYVRHRWFHGSRANSLPADLNSIFGASTQASVNIDGVFVQAGITFETEAGRGSKGLIYNEAETEFILQLGTRL